MGRSGQGAFGGVLHNDRPPLGNRQLSSRVVGQGDDEADGAVGVEAAGAVGQHGQRRALFVQHGDADLADGCGLGQLIDDDLQAARQVGRGGQQCDQAVDQRHFAFAAAGFVEGRLRLLGQAQVLQVCAQLPGDGGNQFLGGGRAGGGRVQFQQANGCPAHGDGLAQARGLGRGIRAAQRAAHRPLFQEALPAAMRQHLRLAGQLLARLGDLGEKARVANGRGQLGGQHGEDGQVVGVQPFERTAVQIENAQHLVFDNHGNGRF